MIDGDEYAREPLPQRGPRSPDRSHAWMRLTYDYLRSLLRELDDVMGLLQAQDHVSIRHIAHRAKGTSGTYGLLPIAEKFAQLEQAAGDRPQEDIHRLVVAIRQLIEAQTEKLRPWIVSSGRDENGVIHG